MPFICERRRWIMCATAKEAGRMQDSGRKGGLLEQAAELDVREVHFKLDPDQELRAIVAIHSTRLGPALGGCRCVPYADSGAAAYDALRLARGMSYKAAICRLPFGGGKAVLMRPLKFVDRNAYFQAFGEFVNELGGRYITAMDSGTEVSDMDAIAQRTAHVACTTRRGGDPAPYTSLGVFHAIEAAAAVCLGRRDLAGARVAIQGTGHVGYDLARRLHEAGARLTVSDQDPDRAARCAKDFAAGQVEPDEIYAVEADIFSPCALGGVLNANTVPRLRAALVAGAANNQLATPADGRALFERGISYAPDYVVNAGGLIQIALADQDDTTITERIEGIRGILTDIFERAAQAHCPPEIMADRIAGAILAGRNLAGAPD
jgi:leucine dehydrogenase